RNDQADRDARRFGPLFLPRLLGSCRSGMLLVGADAHATPSQIRLCCARYERSIAAGNRSSMATHSGVHPSAYVERSDGKPEILDGSWGTSARQNRCPFFQDTKPLSLHWPAPAP